MSDLDLAVLIAELHEERARRRGFAPTNARRVHTEESCLAALAHAAIAMLEETGRLLETVPEYKRFKPAWGPSPTRFYDFFSSWLEALDAAGLGGSPQPLVELTLHSGRPKGGGTNWTSDQCVQALLLGRERLFGHRFSRDVWDVLLRRIFHRELPNSNQITGRTNGRATRSWDEMHDRADARALTRPDLYPHTALRAGLAQHVRREGAA